MSPSEAPESVEPNCAIASFSSATWRALIGEGHAARLAVELGDARIDLLAGGETLGTLIATVASKLVTLDEGGEVGVDDLHFDAAILHLENLAGDDLALLESRRLPRRGRRRAA